MANRARGYADVCIGNETFELAFGLGVLAEIESEFDVESFEEALDFGDKVSASRLRKLMFALLRGNEVELTPERRRAVDMMSPADFMEKLTAITGSSPLTQQQTQEPKEKATKTPFRARNAGRRG
jgi:hypothetical protein